MSKRFDVIYQPLLGSQEQKTLTKIEMKRFLKEIALGDYHFTALYIEQLDDN